MVTTSVALSPAGPETALIEIGHSSGRNKA